MPSLIGRFFGLSLSALFLLSLANAPTASAAYKYPVTVFPSPGTPVASESTTFSFRGVKPRYMGPIKVYGAQSGRHFGRRLAHSDGRGVSFIAYKNFTPGELVRVYTRKKIWGARNGDFAVRIGRFYGNDDKLGHPGAPNKFPALHSRPDLKPPKINILKHTDQAYPGRVFFAPKQTGLTILDSHGRINWFQMTGYGGNGEQVQDFHPQYLNGQQVLTYWKGASTSRGFSQLGYFSVLNRKYNVIARFRVGNGYKPDAHEMTLSPRGTAFTISYRGVLWDTSRFAGGTKTSRVMDNVIQEIDIKTGAVIFEWHSIGNINLEASVNKATNDGAPWDFFHANAISNDGDSILVSARHTCSIYRIDRRTGWLRWRLRGDGRKPKTNDFRLGKGTRFGYQHDIRRLKSGNISMFDNGSAGDSMPAVQKQSSGLILKLTNKGKGRRTATLVHRYKHKPKGVTSGSQGSMTLLPNGNALLGWGSNAQISEITPKGDIAFDATFNTAPTASYRARKAQWMGIPKFRPAIASQGTAKGGTVWASWNGATNIARWRVLSGPDAKHLAVIGNSPWKNLETTIPVEKFGKMVMVQAIDYKNKVIGNSKLTPLGKQAR
ncbi:MAG: aryl-sulfate sulfotransferase [Solirubrobacterales bacterium]|nr:aryl-sulfate sulfotransferase [Solirubrobacterales bacterium]